MPAQSARKGHVHQTPSPGQHLLQFRGDLLVFKLQVQARLQGKAYVRTNIGHARTIRDEIIRYVELNEAPLGRDWYDVPMKAVSPGEYEVTIVLNEVGHFEAKCLFIPEGQTEPLWPEGPNTGINVEPADTVCGNIVYNAFVRQFGAHKNEALCDLSQAADCLKSLDSQGFAVIPPSGTFRDLIAELDFIMGRLGCRLIQLLPIHPTPTTYARMGRYGSPYAALSFTAVDPALAVFDPKATPLEQFIELLDGVHARGGKVIIDIAINHTGWAASLHETHPQWLARKENGEIENPGAWGVVWADLTRLDYSHKDMWQYMADIFLTWCRRGVDGFRCDAGYMIPTPAWKYIIAKVREQFPDALFFLEGLGGKISVTRDLLNRANFNWAYSELFQNYDRGQIEWYLPEANEISASDGITIHFAETHDNNRLAATSATYARMRTALCALLAPHGAFGFANGVEWLATEKINVHEACALNWGAGENQVDAIARLSHLLKTHPAFGPNVSLSLISHGDGNFVVLARENTEEQSGVVIAGNLDMGKSSTAGWLTKQSRFLKTPLVDLLTGAAAEASIGRKYGRIALAPGQVVCLSHADDPWLHMPHNTAGATPPAVTRQRLRAKALEVATVFQPDVVPDPDRWADALQKDPETFCRQINPNGPSSRVIPWHFPTDLNRDVMVPPDHFILIVTPHPFRARIVQGDHVLAGEESLLDDRQRSFILFKPLNPPDTHMFMNLEISLFDPQGTRHDKSRLLFLAPCEKALVRTGFSRNDCHALPLTVLGTNGRGAMMRIHADWGLASRYDAWLAANLHPDFPDDRQITLSRCRAWIVYQGYSQEIKLDCLEQFGFSYTTGAVWRYQIHVGQGEHIVLRTRAQMLSKPANTVVFQVERLARHEGQDELSDDKAVTLILRPDVEDRNFHQCTKAFTGPEQHWPAAVQSLKNGFRFAPGPDHGLIMQVDNGVFYIAPEWYYMVHRPFEAQRGLDADSDLFSPGYFSSVLGGGSRATFSVHVNTDGNECDLKAIAEKAFMNPAPADKALSLSEAMPAALDQYVVRRGDFNTIIAGFPWFLDWGRDTLIAVRGLIAAGRIETSKAILAQFAQFEQNGTLPNMIRGDDARNRDTSDAPLWFFTACADLLAMEGTKDFLDDTCNGRTIRQILVDMASALMAGTPNGIAMDPASGLIYSPSHFTWMDTNYPAGTPRQGYPIEIQALWYAALTLLQQITPTDPSDWGLLAQKVKKGILAHFWLPEQGFLSDCLHARPGQSAAEATADDALRSNQLLAVTLGAVDEVGIVEKILDNCLALLVPGAIRSLANRPVTVPMPVYRDGQLLNDPVRPYWGRYEGDEDTRRKPAYHNGTAWTWPFPSFCEAWAMHYKDEGKAAALAWLSSSTVLINSHCVGHIPEIVDGDTPHAHRGCDAQAWGVSELLRVWKKLDGP